MGDRKPISEVLTAVAERRPGGVFAVMETVSDSGADLAEFAGGLAELLRAVVMQHYGVAPEGLPESTRRLIATIAPKLGPEDAVRMLKLLGEAESGIRRSNNPRIGLETLLLRWALMDRASDLRAILAGSPPSAPAAVRPIPFTASPEPRAQSLETRAQSPEPRAQGPRPEAQSPEPGQSPEPRAQGPRPEGTELDSEKLAAAWSEVLATASRQSPMLGQALGYATARVAGPGIVELAFGPDSALFHDGVARQVASVETILAATLGVAVAVRLGGPADGAAGTDRKPKRLTVDEIRSERLTRLRSKDPAGCRSDGVRFGARGR